MSKIVTLYYAEIIISFSLLQEVIDKLHQKDIKIEDDDVEQVISLKQYIETFHEPDFLKIDSEYNISRRLPLVCSHHQFI